MQYRTITSTGDALSALGYGCMRFPRKYGAIDFKRTERQILSAIALGVNYFDTAYIYPQSEEVLGRILASNGVRDRVKIATKLPLPALKKAEDIEKIFNKQLTRLQTDKIDYYLVHNIVSFSEWERVKSLGVQEFIRKERKRGRIVNIGFSSHGNISDFKRVIDDYPWQFCQIQYNYLDENFQAGREGLLYAHSKGLGVIVMEPLRGGLLVSKMPKEAKKALAEYKIRRSPAEWALRWIWNHPEVTLLLSGMNDEEHIAENARVADAATSSLTEEELRLIEGLKEIFKAKIKVACTGCAYCMPCPHGVNIPQCFALYNDRALFNSIVSRVFYFAFLDSARNPSKASLCTKCGVCLKKCPQHLNIPELLEDTAKNMENPLWRFLVRLGRKLTYRS